MGIGWGRIRKWHGTLSWIAHVDAVGNVPSLPSAKTTQGLAKGNPLRRWISAKHRDKLENMAQLRQIFIFSKIWKKKRKKRNNTSDVQIYSSSHVVIPINHQTWRSNPPSWKKIVKKEHIALWSSGALALSSFGALALWSFETLALWNFETNGAP